MKNKMKIAGVLATVSFSSLLVMELYLIKYAIGKKGRGGERKAAHALHRKKSVKEAECGNKAAEQQAEHVRPTTVQSDCDTERKKGAGEQKICVTAKDGLLLSGALYEQTGSHRWTIVIHGYRGDHHAMHAYIQRYHDAGYCVLAPDLRSCGESEGKHLGMGWPDRKDMLVWVAWILRRDPQARIILHGVSMGGATVMMTSGEETPDAVRAFVEDCGYTSVWDIFACELKYRFAVPRFPLLHTANALAKICVGYSFKEASALRQVKKCHKPMLFIHGTADDFVPFRMLDELYEAKPGTNKQKLVVRDAGHCRCERTLGEEYWKTVYAFLNKYLD
ncbi:MAG: alpha/beta hydrolase [Lachnospiraceae bacterium]|nr:alpha/beta hydrolase [Lachnospiraceae bacterium]